MSNTNFLHVEEPDYYIKVGIKLKKVVRIDWSELIDKECQCDSCRTDAEKSVKKYLSDALQMLKRS